MRQMSRGSVWTKGTELLKYLKVQEEKDNQGISKYEEPNTVFSKMTNILTFSRRTIQMRKIFLAYLLFGLSERKKEEKDDFIFFVKIERNKLKEKETFFFVCVLMKGNQL